MIPEMPPGRFRKATVETWESWHADGAPGTTWLPHELDAARRLIKVVDDLYRAKDEARRRRLTITVRTGERDLGLRAKRGRPKRLDPVEMMRERNRASRARRPRASVAEIDAATQNYSELYDN